MQANKAKNDHSVELICIMVYFGIPFGRFAAIVNKLCWGGIYEEARFGPVLG